MDSLAKGTWYMYVAHMSPTRKFRVTGKNFGFRGILSPLMISHVTRQVMVSL